MAHLPPLATVADLEQRLGVPVGSLAGEDLARAEADLDDASTLVRHYAGVDWVDEDGVTVTAPDSVRTVAVRAAKRSFDNPEGLIGEQLGQGAYGWQRDKTMAQGVYLTDGEIAIVQDAAYSGPGRHRVYSVRTPWEA
jgi:hypothetical protein